MITQPQTIGMIAGGGQFPILFARAAQERGMRVVAAAHAGQSSEKLEELVDSLCWIKLGQLGKIINHFKKEGVHQTVMLGSIKKTNIFRDVRPDLKGLSLWNKVDARQDDALLRAVAGELEKEGITIVASTDFLPDLLFPKGVLTRKKPTGRQREDIKFGWNVARQIGAMDIGQCVVVRNRTVLAVEAIEGTDATIKRGGSLAKERAVVVKLKKPNQDFRFDLPAVGSTTIASMKEVGANVLAVEAAQALLFDRETFIKEADKAKICVVGVEELPDGTLSF
jgi:DUF1009 family protein